MESRGGDTLTNAPDSAEPDNPDFVLPERGRARRSAYVRIGAAAVLRKGDGEPTGEG